MPNLEPYDNLFWDFRFGVREEACGYIAGRARLYCQKSVLILLEYRNYIAGRLRLYCRKSAAILPEECGYIAGRARLYFCNENSGLPKLLCWSHGLRSDQKVSFPSDKIQGKSMKHVHSKDMDSYRQLLPCIYNSLGGNIYSIQGFISCSWLGSILKSSN